MTDLTPDDRAALERVVAEVFHDHGPVTLDPADIAIWRAARAYQAEQDAKICEHFAGVRLNQAAWSAGRCAEIIRERAKGLT